MQTIIKANNINKRFYVSQKFQPDTLKEFLTSLMYNPSKILDKKQTTLWALKDISFEIMKGEVFGIIGPNGSGKSTLLKILSRIIEPTSGQIMLYGSVSSLLEVGTGFHPDLTGRENVFLNGAILGMTKKEIYKSFDQIVDFAGTEKFIDTPVKHYSSGMYIRLAFSVGIHLRSEILILDEVLAVGDENFQQKFTLKLKDLIKEQKTILLVSHSQELIQTFCQRVMLITNGRIRALGKTKEVLQTYQEYCLKENISNNLKTSND
jgi:lipopolysaccharide transport system ATP-binding protein